MVASVAAHLRQRGVGLHLSDAAEEIAPQDDRLLVRLRSGVALPADLVVMSVGVRPENQLAVDCGLQVGPRGGVLVDSHMRTSDPSIYAVGDAVQVQHFVDGSPVQIPLGGPANRQGRIAADHLFGRDSQYRGTQGTSVVGVLGMTAAMTGLSEKSLVAAGAEFRKAYVHATHHAGYYPGAESMSLKLLFHPAGGKLLGAQAVGGAGVDKRIDVLAVAIQAGMTVYDLEEMELAYAPQYGSAKDPVNMAGFVAAGILRGDQPVVHAAELLATVEEATRPSQASGKSPRLIVDVRTPSEYAAGHIPGAVSIPIEQLRDRLDQLPRDRPLVTYCQVGQRGYLATRALLQHGYDAANLSGGFTTYQHVADAAG